MFHKISQLIVVLGLLTAIVLLGVADNYRGLSKKVVQVGSSPSGALITINDKPVGVTPFEIKLNPGIYKLTAEKDGFYSTESFSEIVRKKRFNSINVHLVPMKLKESDETKPEAIISEQAELIELRGEMSKIKDLLSIGSEEQLTLNALLNKVASQEKQIDRLNNDLKDMSSKIDDNFKVYFGILISVIVAMVGTFLSSFRSSSKSASA
ncbi:PEGA domain-containing protein [Vibrio sp. T20]|uniref:PEGA domain-containing protein n=1 Tax=Vibrio sp. T20 TaxID=2588450 RepID=UPI0011B84E07|nr:PEGA domain-containing protein [Vibrio sp. T20]